MATDLRPSTIVLDPIGGVSGDMFIAAMLNTWPSLLEPVVTAVRSSGVPPATELFVRECRSGALSGFRLHIESATAVPSGAYPEVRQRLAAAGISEPARAHALAILDLLAQAEAKVHRVPVEEVHFHELADWDTQIEIVAAAVIIDLLDGAQWYCRPLPLGAGYIRSAHGLLPVPAPAVTQLLEGFAFRADDGVAGERVTPTGAAILRHLRPDFAASRPAGILVATGVGAGSREVPGIPNVLRVLGFAPRASELPNDSVLVIEFDIDDESPEEVSLGLDRLRKLPGVLDVVSFLGIGKKGRWVQAVRVMADPTCRSAVVRAAFDQTATLGLRIREEAREVLARHNVVVVHDSGPVRVKVVDRPGGRTAKAEADDIAERAGTAEARARLRRSTVEQALGEPTLPPRPDDRT